MHSSKRKHIFLSSSIIAMLIICISLAPAQAAVSATSDKQGEERAQWSEILEQVWGSRFSDLESLRQDIRQYTPETEQGQAAAKLNMTMRQLEQEKNRLLRLFAASASRPTEQLLVVLQMHNLKTEMTNALEPLQRLDAALTEYSSTLEKFKQEIASFNLDEKQDEAYYDKVEQEHLATYKKELSSIEKELARLSRIYSSPLTSAKKLLNDFGKAIDDIEFGLVTTWKNFYFSKVEYSLHDINGLSVSLGNWSKSLFHSVNFDMPHDVKGWAKVALTFIIWFGALAGIGLFAYRKCASLPARWRDASRQVLKGAWLWVSAGFALIISSETEYGGFYFSSSFTGVLLMIWGIGSLSWRLRLAAKPELSGQPLPFGRLFPPAALGAVCLYLEVPSRLLGLIWGLSMVIFILVLSSINRRQKENKTKLPRMEVVLYGCAKYIGLLSLLIMLLGYPRFAIIIFMGLFALANIVTLGHTLGILFKILIDRTVNKEQLPLRNALLRSAVSPLAWVISLLCTLPWQWGTPGANYLIKYAMGLDYKIGVLNIGIAKFVLILLIFMVFRTLIRLGRGSLETLPRSMPNIEHGVVPPLQTLLTYSLWALFVIIALGILGVSLTSLAVVAGGLSVGIGFGMQNIFSNLVSGFMLMFGRSIMVGDAIDIGDISGVVSDISVRSTTIRTWDLAQVNVPNSTLMSTQFTNWTRGSRTVRRSVSVGAGYDSDPAKVYQLMLQAAENDPHVVKKPAPWAVMTNFGESSLDFIVYFVVDDFNAGRTTEARVRCEILRLFNENNISIPYPQLDVHMPPVPDQTLKVDA